MKSTLRHRIPRKTPSGTRQRRQGGHPINPLSNGQSRWIRFNRYGWDKRRG